MLLPKVITTNQIVTFKLVNGEEVVGKLVEENDSFYIVHKPMSLTSNEQGVGLVQSMYSADINTNIPLNKSTVIMAGPTVEAIADHYTEVTTGIKAIRKGSIIV